MCLSLLLLVALVAPACRKPVAAADDMDSANKLVEEGNVEIEAGRKDAEAGLNKSVEAFDFDEKTGTRADWENLKQPAREASDLLGSAALSYSKASVKFEEAAKLNVAENFRQYLDLKAQELRKRSERLRAAKEIPEGLLNDSIADSKALLSRVDEVRERTARLSDEADQLEARADKIRQDNADKFGSQEKR